MKVGYSTRWKPGQSGNPKGRPRRQLCVTDQLRAIGRQKHVQPDGSEVTKMKALAARLWEAALAGEPWAISFIVDRIEGRPATQTERMMLEGLASVEERKIIVTPLLVPPGVTIE